MAATYFFILATDSYIFLYILQNLQHKQLVIWNLFVSVNINSEIYDHDHQAEPLQDKDKSNTTKITKKVILLSIMLTSRRCDDG